MVTPTITTANEVYAFIADLKTECGKHGVNDLANKLDDALCLGSSGLEILGAIRITLAENRAKVESLLGSEGLRKAEQVIAFVDRTYGRLPP
jgi:hypothetical protein